MEDEIELDLTKLTKDELIVECQRREKVAHNIWGAITSVYGPAGFLKIVTHLEKKKQIQQQLIQPAIPQEKHD